MSAPFEFELKMMGSQASLDFLVPDFGIDQSIHAQDELIAGKPGARPGRAAEFAINYLTDTLEHATHQSFRKDRVAFWFWCLVLLVGHGSEYECRSDQVQGLACWAVKSQIF